jgi:hypothetical protein
MTLRKEVSKVKNTFLLQLDKLSEDITIEKTDTNNIHALVLAKTGEQKPPPAKKAYIKPFRLTLAAALAFVITITTLIAASAEFRETIAGLFSATSTTQVAPGLDRDSFLIFDEAIADNQTINLWDGVIYKINADIMAFASYYEYRHGGIMQIETNSVDEIIYHEGTQYHIRFDYGLRANGDLMAVISQAAHINIENQYKYFFTVEVIPGRTDVVLLKLGLDRFGDERHVLFDLSTREIVFTFPNQVLAFNPSGVLAFCAMPVQESATSATEITPYLININTGEITQLDLLISFNQYVGYTYSFYRLTRYNDFYDWIDDYNFLFFVPSGLIDPVTPWGSGLGDYARYNIVTGEIVMVTEDTNLMYLHPNFHRASPRITGDYFLVQGTGNSNGLLNQLTGETNMLVLPGSQNWDSWGLNPSPNGQWMGFMPYTTGAREELYIYNMQSGESFNLTSDVLDGRMIWSYTWLDANILAVVAEGDEFVDISPDGILNRGKHLYVFRIDEEFLRAR